ncbi:MAG: hypothetical protein Q8K32_07225 [Archangium sp.]|nr:hypothetical protein [Archangium sp.]
MSDLKQEKPSAVEEIFPYDPRGELVLESGKLSEEEANDLMDFAATAVQLTAKAACYLSWLADRGGLKREDVLAACGCLASSYGLPSPEHYQAGLRFLAENGLVLGGVELFHSKGYTPVWNPESRRSRVP